MIQNQYHNLCIAVMLCTNIPLYTTQNYFDLPDALDAYADVSYEKEEISIKKTHYWHDKSLYYIRRATCIYIVYELACLYKEHTTPASYLSRFVPSLIQNTYAECACAVHIAFILGKAYVYHAIATTIADTLLGQEKEAI